MLINFQRYAYETAGMPGVMGEDIPTVLSECKGMFFNGINDE